MATETNPGELGWRHCVKRDWPVGKRFLENSPESV